MKTLISLLIAALLIIGIGIYKNNKDKVDPVVVIEPEVKPEKPILPAKVVAPKSVTLEIKQGYIIK